MKYAILILCLLSASFLAAQDDSCWGKDARCSDGNYRGPGGDIQPDTCDIKSEHPCECERASTCEGSAPNSGMAPGSKCKTYCRKNACSCVKVGCS
jgi:hypothetical protein